MKKRKPKKREKPKGGTFIPYPRNDSNVKRMDGFLRSTKAKRKHQRSNAPQRTFADGAVVHDQAREVTGIIDGITQIKALMVYATDPFAYRLRVGAEIILASPLDVVKVTASDSRRVLHREYLSSVGITAQRYIPRRKGKKYRETHCWRCKAHLDSVSDLECIRCGWLICDCGACACGTWWDPNRER